MGAGLGARGRLAGLSPRAVKEISLGLLTANIGDAVNVFVVASVIAWFLDYPLVPALLPGLASLRGGIVTSMAARASTALHLGTLRPTLRGVLAVEGLRVLALALASAVYVALAASVAAGLAWHRAVVAAVVSTLASYALLAPAAALVAIGAFRRGLDPDRLVAPVLTVAGDMATIPTLLLGVRVAVFLSDSASTLAGVAGVWGALVAIAVAAARPADRRVVAESMPAMLLVGVLEAVAGGLLEKYKDVLASVGVLHVTPSFLEDTGAASAIVASRLSTILHLYGEREAAARAPALAAESLAGSLPSLGVLAGIGIAASWAALGGSPAWLPAVLGVAWPTVVAAGSALAYLVAVATYRAGMDPDNLAVPLVTSAVDVVGTLALAAAAMLIP